MLSELSIQNFAIIDELQVQFSFGFNVLTGETGAGKSILLDSVMLLLGGRADTSMIRAGAERAILEATFELTPTVQSIIQPLLATESLEGDEVDVISLGREVRAAGRSVCRINGRIVPLATLRQFGGLLVDIHGQGEHLSLLKPKSHLPLLDAYAHLQGEQKMVVAAVHDLRSVQKELKQLQQNARQIAQRIDFLRFQIDEINAAKLVAGEEETLKAERTRLANVEQLLTHTSLAVALIDGVDDETLDLIDMLGKLERALTQLAKLDGEQSGLVERLQGLSFQFSDLASDVANYQAGLEFNPTRLDEVETRLELINQLKRKYGEDVPAILVTLATAENELESIAYSESRIEVLQGEEEKLLHTIGKCAQKLSLKRQTAAKKLAQVTEAELRQLRMEGARFEVECRHSPHENGAYVDDKRLAFDLTGIDQIQFLISTNPGEPLKPMAKVASGGETARLMLALKTALAQVDATPTLIFDEIDQGIGGRLGDTVGHKLWGLTQHGGHQVIVVTHLPQLAGYGDVHLHVSKRINGGRTTTGISRLENAGRVKELAAMLGTQEKEARQGAESILRGVAERKG